MSAASPLAAEPARARLARHARDVVRWSSEIRTSPVLAPALAPALVPALTAALGMAVPVALGLAADRPAAGLAAALGALTAGDVGALTASGAGARRAAASLGPGLAGAALGAMRGGGGGWTSAALVAIVGLAAVLGGLSRPMAIATTRFALSLWIVSALPAQPPGHAAALVILVALGALWTTLVGLALGAWLRRSGTPPIPSPTAPAPTARQRYRHWRRSLTTLAGWSYAVRLTAALAAAQLAAARWPDHHLHWIGLTVILVTPRPRALVPVLLTQRALGTALGVLVAAGLALGDGLPPWALVVAIGALAAARPLLRPRSYLAYALVMTPLIVLLLDCGRAPSPGLLDDRLLATLAGAALVIAASAGFHRRRP